MNTNIFLPAIEKQIKLEEYITFSKDTDTFFDTNYLMDKFNLLKELNVKIDSYILNFLHQKKDIIGSKELEKKLIKYLSKLNFGSKIESVKINPEFLLTLDVDKVKAMYKDIFQQSYYRSNRYYMTENNHHLYANDIDVISLSIKYNINDNIYNYLASDIFPNKDFRNIEDKDLFSYFENLNIILEKHLNQYMDMSKFELVEESDADKVYTELKTFLNILKDLKYSFIELNEFLKLFNKHNFDLNKIHDVFFNINGFKSNNIFELLDFGFKYYNDFKITKNDLIFIEELLKEMNINAIKIEDVSVNRYKEVYDYLIKEDLYNISMIKSVIKLITTDDEINLKLSEQSKVYNKIITKISEFEKNKNTDVILNNLLYLNVKKSKTFLNLLSNHSDFIFNYLKENTKNVPLLFSENLFKFVHVNMITDKTIFKLLETNTQFIVEKTMNDLYRNESSLFNEKLTPELFMEMNNPFKVELVHLLNDKNIKKDIIIRILKSFDNVKEGNSMIKNNIYLNIIGDMDEKSLNQLFQFRNNYSKTMDRNTALMIHLLKQKFDVFNQVTSSEELEFLLANDDNLGETIAGMLEHILDSKTEYKSFTKKLEASNTFFEEYKMNLTKFFTKGLHRIVNEYIQGMSLVQTKNAYLLSKAEIANRLFDVKFQNIENELELNLTEEFKSKWKTLLVNENDFTIKEVVDFKTLFELGQNPTNSCMNYKTGSYKRCLLSIFDSTKQYIGVYDKGKLVGRAILRLTKTVDYHEKAQIGFVDVEKMNEEKQNVSKKDIKETPVLFLERLYTSYTGSKYQKMKEELIDLVTLKADSLGIEFIAANDYSSVEKVKRSYVKKNIFITHSQNGNQYLDSFGGSHSEDAGGVYKVATDYVLLK